MNDLLLDSELDMITDNHNENLLLRVLSCFLRTFKVLRVIFFFKISHDISAKTHVSFLNVN